MCSGVSRHGFSDTHDIGLMPFSLAIYSHLSLPVWHASSSFSLGATVCSLLIILSLLPWTISLLIGGCYCL